MKKPAQPKSKTLKPTKKQRSKLLKQKVARITRAVLVAAFVSLFLVGATSVTRALTLEDVANTNGIPNIWGLATNARPDTITLPITYFDQKSDPCDSSSRQFEWGKCGNYSYGLQQGLVNSRLGTDDLPVPAYTSTTSATAAGVTPVSRNVTGNNPVLPSDNFYRWFHEVDNKSQRVDREITFNHTGNGNTYQYGGTQIFPLDDHPFSAGDISVNNRNFHFTAHLQIPIKITLDGTESFDFSGDDDVWVFLNDQLVLDIGGVHTALPGKFTINKDGGVTSTVSGKTTTINTNLKANQVVNLDFFYAERNTTEANTLITINNMNWPIIADSTLTAQISDNELIEYNASLTNRDTINNLDLTHLASHLSDDETEAGFLPLCYKSLFYTATPDDEDSWKPLALSMPSNTEQGFKLDTPLTLAPHGTSGDTMYFRYYVAPEKPTGQLQNVIAFRTYQNKYAGITYADAPITFANLDIPDSTPGTDTENPENPGDNTGNGTTDPIDPEDDTIADNEDDLYLPPLGEIIYVPQTGAITRSLSSLFASDNFATFILSQGFILANLAVFAVSFTIFYPLRRFL